MRMYAAVALAILLGPLPSNPEVKTQLTEAEAIRLAEKFVADNGYTDLPLTKEKTKLSYESIDSADAGERLTDRYATLERKAYAVGRRNVSNNGWTIAFRYNANNERYRRIIPDYEQHTKNTGRAVTMNADGSSIRIQHQEIYLKGLKVIRRGGK